MLPRKLYLDPKLDNPEPVQKEDSYDNPSTPTPAESSAEANLVSSELDYPEDSSVSKNERLHAPAIDLDVKAELIPSSTPGHSHLYIDRPMTWKRYKKLLKALSKAGIIEEGYYQASIARGASFLRKPGIWKKPQGTVHVLKGGNIVIQPAGTGPQGPQGPKGDTGPPGPAGSKFVVSEPTKDKGEGHVAKEAPATWDEMWQ